jgi:hypothetical protein
MKMRYGNQCDCGQSQHPIRARLYASQYKIEELDVA